MQRFDTSGAAPRGSDLRLSVYNGLDCCITREILPVLEAQLDEVSERSYGFSLQCLGPALDMMGRGIKVDGSERRRVLG